MSFFDLPKLPPMSKRQAIGIWKMDLPGPSKMHRSIEKVGEEYFLVVRVRTADGKRFGGDEGMRLDRISATEFRGTGANAMTYRITSTGFLQHIEQGRTESDMDGSPTTELWPSDA